MTATAQPFEARQCPICLTWIKCGPTSHADYRHWEKVHATDAEKAADVVGFPYFNFNEVPVTAVTA